MAKEKKLVEAITSMEEDFAQWYTDIVKKAELIDYTSVKGCMVIKPAGYAIWENIQKELDARFKETGVENVYFSAHVHSRESAAERKGSCGRICAGGCLGHPRRSGTFAGKDSACVPRRRRCFCDLYSRDIHSHRDLPKVYNQWCSVVRWEKTTRPFLRFPASSSGRKGHNGPCHSRGSGRAYHHDAESLRGFLRGSAGDPGDQRKEDRQGKICRSRVHLHHRISDA